MRFMLQPSAFSLEPISNAGREKESRPSNGISPHLETERERKDQATPCTPPPTSTTTTQSLLLHRSLVVEGRWGGKGGRARKLTAEAERERESTEEHRQNRRVKQELRRGNLLCSDCRTP